MAKIANPQDIAQEYIRKIYLGGFRATPLAGSAHTRSS
jgi:hypothetical protein